MVWIKSGRGKGGLVNDQLIRSLRDVWITIRHPQMVDGPRRRVMGIARIASIKNHYIDDILQEHKRVIDESLASNSPTKNEACEEINILTKATIENICSTYKITLDELTNLQ